MDSLGMGAFSDGAQTPPALTLSSGNYERAIHDISSFTAPSETKGRTAYRRRTIRITI